MTTAFTGRVFLALSVLTPVSQAYADDLLTEMRACAAERDDARRLACYDARLRPAPSKPQTTEASPQQPREIAGGSAAPVAAAAEQQFGMNEALAKKSQPAQTTPRLDKLQARVVAVSRKPRGEPIVTLENGQVWEAADGEPAIELKTGDVVTIWPGLFGSFRLAAAGHSLVRVSRVR